MADLASIISGTDPLAPLVLQAEQQQQQLNSARDASQWANQGIFGALARTIAGGAGGGAQNTLQQIVQQRQAAQPDLATLLAGPDPYGALAAAQPGQYNPLAVAQLLNGATPGSVAEARLHAAQANLFGAKTDFARQQGDLSKPILGTYSPQAARPAANGPAASAPSAAEPLVSGTGDISSLTNGRTATTAPDLQSLARMPDAQRAAIIAGLTPQQKARIAAQLRGMAGRNAAGR